MMTEDQAETKWCPFSRLAGEGNRHDDGKLMWGARCVGQGCMAWRWDDDALAKMVDVEADHHPSAQDAHDAIEREGRYPGFCGLAGKP